MRVTSWMSSGSGNTAGTRPLILEGKVAMSKEATIVATFQHILS